MGDFRPQDADGRVLLLPEDGVIAFQQLGHGQDRLALVVEVPVPLDYGNPLAKLGHPVAAFNPGHEAPFLARVRLDSGAAQ